MKQEKTENEFVSIKRFTNLVLDIGTFLLASGAHSGRVNSNITRIAERFGFEVNLDPSFKGLLISVKNRENPNETFTLFRKSPPHEAHFQILTEVSLLSWRVADECMSFEDTEREFSRIKELSGYNPWLVAVAVGCSCAGLCIFSLGDIYNAMIAFTAAFIGSISRVKIMKMNFNPMVCIMIAAFITTIITGLGTLFNIGARPEAAMATAVLYLIPGVPLINSVIDLIEGYLTSAMNRSLFAGFILLCIAVGMTLSITLMGINNF